MSDQYLPSRGILNETYLGASNKQSDLENKLYHTIDL